MENKQRIVNPKCAECGMCSKVTHTFANGARLQEHEQYYQCLAMMEGECVKSVMITEDDLALQHAINKLQKNDGNGTWDEITSIDELRNSLVEARKGYKQNEETYSFYQAILIDLPGPGGFKEIEELGWVIHQTGGNCRVAEKQFGNEFICVTDDAICSLDKSIMEDIDETNYIKNICIEKHTTVDMLDFVCSSYEMKQEVLKVYQLFCREYGWEPCINDTKHKRISTMFLDNSQHNNQAFLEALENFRTASVRLLGAWLDTGIDGTAGYPFNKDFTEITAEIVDWHIKQREELK